MKCFQDILKGFTYISAQFSELESCNYLLTAQCIQLAPASNLVSVLFCRFKARNNRYVFKKTQGKTTQKEVSTNNFL